ncbi:MAG: DUF2807 domain-containing protein [Chloroflexota bacterium]
MPARAPRRALAQPLALAIALTLVAGACVGPLSSPTPVPASSDSKTETRTVSAFTALSVSGPLNVVLAAGSAVSVQVEAPTSILPLIKTEVAGTELDVSVLPPGYTSAKPVTIRVTSPKVASVSLADGATATVEAMAKAMTISVAGGATVKGIGTVQQLTVAVVGNSSAELGDLAADTAAISIAGGAKATLRVSKQLTGTADGGSVVTLMVKPEAKSVTVTGGAKLVEP